jgi:uncharacterized protein YdaT
LTANWGWIEALQKAWHWDKNLTTEEIKNKLFGTDNEGRTAWLLAADWGSLMQYKKKGFGLKRI